MKRLMILPEGWPCTLAECRPGFFLFKDSLCLKDEYGSEGGSYAESGEYFWGGTSSNDARAALVVQPVHTTWEEYEE